MIKLILIRCLLVRADLACHLSAALPIQIWAEVITQNCLLRIAPQKPSSCRRHLRFHALINLEVELQ